MVSSTGQLESLRDTLSPSLTNVKINSRKAELCAPDHDTNGHT